MGRSEKGDRVKIDAWCSVNMDHYKRLKNSKVTMLEDDEANRQPNEKNQQDFPHATI